MSKQRRQTKILNLIQTRTVLSQTQLSQRLKAEGVHVAQATLSRDLRALNLIKTPKGYKLPDQLGSAAGNSDQQRLTILGPERVCGVGHGDAPANARAF